MVWFKVDDGFPTSRKVLSIPKRRRAAAIGVWTLAGAWSAHELTNGFVPVYALEEIASGIQSAPDLVAARLWIAVSKGSRVFPDGSPTDAQPLFDGTPNDPRVIPDDGWMFRNWPRYQPDKEDVLKERADHAARQKAYRDRLKAKRDAERDASRDAAVTAPSVTAARPDPTRPDPTVLPTEVLFENPSSPAAPTMPCHADFVRFWELYPRKVGKIGAEKAYAKAIKKVGVQKVAAGLQRFISDPNLPADKSMIPHAATWLNDGRWDDEPYPVEHTERKNGFAHSVVRIYEGQPGQRAREA